MHALIILLALAWQGGDAVSSPVQHSPDEAAHAHADDHGDHDMDEAAHEPPRRPSYLAWLYMSLGPRYTLAFLLLTPALFLGSLVLVATSKRPGPIAAFLPLLALPLLVGGIGFFEGMISALVVIAESSTSPRPAEIAEGVSMALMTPLVALVLSLPSYLIVSIGLLVRSLMYHSPGKDR